MTVFLTAGLDFLATFFGDALTGVFLAELLVFLKGDGDGEGVNYHHAWSELFNYFYITSTIGLTDFRGDFLVAFAMMKCSWFAKKIQTV